MLPGSNGEALLPQIRAICDTPILILSARDKLDGKVKLLTEGNTAVFICENDTEAPEQIEISKVIEATLAGDIFSIKVTLPLIP